MAPGTITPEREVPTLTFRRYAIAFHLIARQCGDTEPALTNKPEPDERATASHEDTPAPDDEVRLAERAMASFEDDMLLYAHRDDPPFKTRVVETATKAVTVRFLPELTYEAEGDLKHVRLPSVDENGRTRTFGLALARTKFGRSELTIHGERVKTAILSLVLTPPRSSAEGSELNEYDVIKLVKLWEGGEGVAGARSAIVEGDDVWFALPSHERLTLHELAALTFPGWQPLHYKHSRREDKAVTFARTGYRVGTVELELPPSEWRDVLFSDIAMLKRHREAPSRDTDRWHRVVALGGILQGLLGFREIEDYELADVFANVDVDVHDESMRAFHKGTLLSVSTENDPEDEGFLLRVLGKLPRRDEDEDKDEGQDEEGRKPIGVDPYLAIPNIVLLHHEQRLKTARLLEGYLAHKQRGPLREWGDRAAIAETEDGLGEMAGLLSQHLPSVFHYSSERRLHKRGRESRGLDDLEAFVRLRMDDLSSVLQWRVRRRDRWTAVLGIAVGVVTAFLVQQAVEGRPLWLIVPAAVALFAVFLWLRDKLF